MKKYKVVKTYWVGMSGTSYPGYVVEKKILFFWWPICSNIFDSVEQAELFIELEQSNNKVVKEIVL